MMIADTAHIKMHRTRKSGTRVLGVSVGREAIVGAGAVLTKDVPDCGAGVATRVVGRRRILGVAIWQFLRQADCTIGPVVT
jgi:acetyltransferase-like isoleucine patch superfamily enzyme